MDPTFHLPLPFVPPSTFCHPHLKNHIEMSNFPPLLFPHMLLPSRFDSDLHLPSRRSPQSNRSFSIDRILNSDSHNDRFSSLDSHQSPVHSKWSSSRKRTSPTTTSDSSINKTVVAKRSRKENCNHVIDNRTNNSAVSSSMDNNKRMRTIFTPDQLDKLEAEFDRQQYMVGSERYYLAASLNLTEAQVKVWFQNRRIKWRKQHLSHHHLQQSDLHQEDSPDNAGLFDETSSFLSDADSDHQPVTSS